MNEIEWFKTYRREDTQLADRKVWRSKCGHYRVESCLIRYGQGQDRKGNETGYPLFFRAMQRTPEGWIIISNHKKLSTAQTALQNRLNGVIKRKRKKKVKA